MPIKNIIEACWYGRSPGALYPLYPLEYLFSSISRARKKKQKAAAEKHDLPVIVVGNIVVGGTGKTPVIIAIARWLKKCELKVGVISRGYGRNAGGEKLHILSDASTATLAGDEPVEIYNACKCPVVVSEDRNFAMQVLTKNFDVDIVLSDDGLQHYKLDRQIEIVLFNQFHGAGNGHCLPLGPLREPLSRLAEADFVLLNKSDVQHPSIAEIKKYDVDVFEVVPQFWVNVNSGQIRELDDKFEGRISAIAGIGQPQKFFNTLDQLGVNYAAKKKPDHAQFSVRDFDKIKFDTFIMTAKDAVKCKGLAPDNSWYLQVEAKFPEPFQNAFLDAVEPLVT